MRRRSVRFGAAAVSLAAPASAQLGGEMAEWAEVVRVANIKIK